MPSPLDAVDLRRRVQQCLDAELATQAAVLAELGPDVDDLLAAVADLLRGGKRLRAAFLYWGHRAAGRPDSDALVRLASAMELFQAAALIHDDVMDDSDTRRGMPAAHRALATRHTARGWAGDEDRFGLAGAVLAGNLCLTWTDAVYATCGLPEADLAARPPGVRPDAHPADGRAVPRRRRVDAAVGGPGRRRAGRAGRSGHPLQEREVHRRAPAAHRRDDRRARRRRPARRCPATASTSAGPSSCATTCSASSATRPRPASPPATTCARASAPCCSPTPCAGTDDAGRARVEALLGRPDLDADQVDELRGAIDGLRRGRRGSRTRSSRLAGSARAALERRRFGRRRGARGAGRPRRHRHRRPS